MPDSRPTRLPDPEYVAEPPPTRPYAEPTRRGDLDLAAQPEVSASRVFQEARSRGEAAPTRLDVPTKLIDKRPKPAPKKGPAPRLAAAPATKVDTSSATEEAMALFEAGDLDGAIASAKESGNTSLAGKIASFKKEIAAAKADLSFRDGAGAIKHYSAALAIDDELSKGWGKLGGQIRVELSKLFQIAGTQAAEKGDSAKAASLFQKALKYDPENAAAQGSLARLKSAPAPAKQEDPRSAADEAFDQ